MRENNRDTRGKSGHCKVHPAKCQTGMLPTNPIQECAPAKKYIFRFLPDAVKMDSGQYKKQPFRYITRVKS